MKLAEGITQDDLKLFLQEADEQIQLLDEDILKLEREDISEELLQGIFRAAHTIKGSSAMIGHNKMSELAHGIENVLDKLRKKTSRQSLLLQRPGRRMSLILALL